MYFLFTHLNPSKRIGATTFYEEQRFGINYSDKPSLVRRNFRKSKILMTSGRPLESVLKHPKLLDTNSRNIGDDIGIFIINKINVANRTMD